MTEIEELRGLLSDSLVTMRNAQTGLEKAEAVIDEQVEALQGLAHARLAPDSMEPGVVRQRSRGKLTCRERIALLLDDDSFREVGSLAGFASYDEDGKMAAFTPANHVGGWGKVDAIPKLAPSFHFLPVLPDFDH